MKTAGRYGCWEARKRIGIVFAVVSVVVSVVPAAAHNVTGDPARPHYDWSVRPPETVALHSTNSGRAAWRVAQADTAKIPKQSESPVVRTDRPMQAVAFEAFAPRVRARWDERFLYIESNGLPTHGMMTGITAWQQQVPLPQPYTGANAWRIPLRPMPAERSVLIKGRFLRGAIAIAANGVPIFNPQNNRGEIAQEIGELDQWGGHCGRADDYHYHATPFHLQSVVGNGRPLAYALDGYPIYGLTEPDGSVPESLDACQGHATAALGYHYHGSTKYPYVHGGFHGVVVELDGQVDPQPRAQSLRPAGAPLRGARITGFEAAADEKAFSLEYVVNGRPATIRYTTTSDGAWQFQFRDPDGTTREETYRADARGNRGGPEAKEKGRRDKAGKGKGD